MMCDKITQPEQNDKIPELYFANMGHGECILFRSSGEYFLRDFGEYAKKETNDIRCSVDRILMSNTVSKCEFNRVLNNKGMINAILSHPHRDHFSGFEQIYNNLLLKNPTSCKKVFKTAFVPMIYSPYSKNEIDNFNTLISANVLIAAASLNFEGKESLSFLKSDLIMAALSEKIIFCSANMKTQTPFDHVFCPRTSVCSDSYTELYDLQQFIDDFLNRQSVNDSKKIIHEIEKIKDILLSFYKSRGSHKYDISVINKKINDISDSVKYVASLIEHTKNSLHKTYLLVENILDKCSLAFDIKLDNISAPWLFLGDNDNPILNSSLIPEKQYDGIKVSHHGTRGANVLRRKEIIAKYYIACASNENKKFKPVDQYFCQKGILILGNPPENADYIRQGELIMNVPCIKYPFHLGRCSSIVGYPKEKKHSMQGHTCIKCKFLSDK